MFVFGVVRLVEVVGLVVFLAGVVFLSEFLKLVFLEFVLEGSDLFESRLFFELSDFALFAFCLEPEFCFESFVLESFVCLAEVFGFVLADFDAAGLDLSGVLFFDVVRASDFDEELFLPFLSVDFFGVGVAFACVFLFGVGVVLAFFLDGAAFVFDEFLVCALSTESAENNAKKMKKAMTNPVF